MDPSIAQMRIAPKVLLRDGGRGGRDWPMLAPIPETEDMLVRAETYSRGAVHLIRTIYSCRQEERADAHVRQVVWDPALTAEYHEGHASNVGSQRPKKRQKANARHVT